jgi:2-oxoglutarate ferredoxin oxidoreductase subunit beta
LEVGLTVRSFERPAPSERIEAASGATFIARTHAAQVNHMIQMIKRAMDHQGPVSPKC